ncbi:MAG: hypothetical protein H7840_17085 [Alphaproteobacteria bacterium]
MTAYKSDQETKRTATPQKMLGTNEHGGRVRVSYFNYTVPTATLAVNDTLNLVTLPKGARILRGHVAWEAMSTAGGTAQIQIGDGTTANKYLDTTSVDAAGSSAFADTIALSYGEELSAETTLVAKAVGEAWAATKKIAGHVLWVVD